MAQNATSHVYLAVSGNKRNRLVHLFAAGKPLAEIAKRSEFGSPWWLAFTLMRDSDLYERCCRVAPFPDLVPEVSEATMPTPEELAAAITWLNAEEAVL